MCIDITEIWMGISNGQNFLIFDRVICLPQVRIFISEQWFELMDFHQLGMCFDIVEIRFLIACG